MFTAIVCFGIMSLTYFICKARELSENKRQHNEYMQLERSKLYPDDVKEPSPYKLIRVQHTSSKTWGYTMAFKSTGKIYSWGEQGYYEILQFDAAKKKLNEVEVAEGYQQTTWGD